MARARNTFTDLGAAIEEAYFLKGEHGHTYALIQQSAGKIWVTKKYTAIRQGYKAMWDTTKKNENVKPLYRADDSLVFGAG